MPEAIFITGIGTGIGKTIISSIITEALQADYWKPIQAGYDGGTDSELVERLISNQQSKIFPETYKLALPASPHVAAREEGLQIILTDILADFHNIRQNSKADFIVIEGAGGLMAPINGQQFVIDLIKQMEAYVIIVSRNYLGSINHSLLTAQACRQKNLKVVGWIFNDQYLNYQEDIVNWSGYPNLYAVPALTQISQAEVLHHSTLIKETLLNRMNAYNDKTSTPRHL